MILRTPWGFKTLFLEKREEDPSEAPSFRCSMLFCFREHGWSIRLQYSREFVHFTHNPWSSPFTDKTMARLSLSSPSTFRIQPCQEPPNVGTQVRFPTKYYAKTEPIMYCGCTGSFWILKHGRLLWFLGGRPPPKSHSLSRQPFRPEENLVLFWSGFEKKSLLKRAFILRKIHCLSNPPTVLYIYIA